MQNPNRRCRSFLLAKPAHGLIISKAVFGSFASFQVGVLGRHFHWQRRHSSSFAGRVAEIRIDIIRVLAAYEKGSPLSLSCKLFLYPPEYKPVALFSKVFLFYESLQLNTAALFYRAFNKWMQSYADGRVALRQVLLRPLLAWVCPLIRWNRS